MITVPIPKVKPELVPVNKTNEKDIAFNDTFVSIISKKSNKLKFVYCENASKKAAELIANNKIIGWFQGRMEAGPRALGNRRILADPRDKNIKDRINSVVKFREGFRPLAPSILEEKTKELGLPFNSSISP